MFVSQPQSQIHEQEEHDSVRVNIDDHFDDQLSVDSVHSSIHSMQQNELILSQRLSNLKQKVESEEHTIHSLKTRRGALEKECKQGLQRLKELKKDITQYEQQKESIVVKVDEMEKKKKEEEGAKDLVQQLMRRSQDFGGQIQRMEQE